MENILKKNEAEINEAVAKGLLVVFSLIALITVFCWIGVFDIFFDMTVIILAIAFITLVVPAMMILNFHFYGDVMKFIIIIATAIMVGAAYTLFTFQAVIIFLIPTIMAGFYMNKRLLCFSAIITICSITVAHIITGFEVRQPWIEPFSGMQAVIRFGLIPRLLQYGGCFILMWIMIDRYIKVLFNTFWEHERIILENEEREDNIDKDKRELEGLLRELTEREKSVFYLIAKGYTNMQIADKLYLSNGTVKNYVSTIYDKLGTKERNTLIMKYSRFCQGND